MKMRTLLKPSVLVAGALEDRGRYLFIKRKFEEIETIELPYSIITQGSNPIQVLSELFLSQLGIDAQVHESIYQARHNFGSRKNKRWIPAIIFRITTKNASAKPAPGLAYAWLSLDDARRKKLSRNSEWLRY